MFSSFWLWLLVIIIAALVILYVRYRKPAVITPTPYPWAPVGSPTWTSVPTWPDDVPPEDPTKKDIVEPTLTTAAPIVNIAPVKKSVPDAAITPVKTKKVTGGKRVTQKSATQDAKGSRRTTKTPKSPKW